MAWFRKTGAKALNPADPLALVIESLVRAIDAKDRVSPDHIRRVRVFATGLARALGMSADEMQGLWLAALLHDIGKLAVPEHTAICRR